MKLSDWNKNAEITITEDNCPEGTMHVSLIIYQTGDRNQNLSVKIDYDKVTSIEYVVNSIVKKREQLYNALISQCTEL